MLSATVRASIARKLISNRYLGQWYSQAAASRIETENFAIGVPPHLAKSGDDSEPHENNLCLFSSINQTFWAYLIRIGRQGNLLPQENKSRAKPAPSPSSRKTFNPIARSVKTILRRYSKSATIKEKTKKRIGSSARSGDEDGSGAVLISLEADSVWTPRSLDSW